MNLKELIRNRILELKDELSYLKTEYESSRNKPAKIKRKISSTEELLTINFNLLASLDVDYMQELQ